jgi:RNA polymerase sigma-70 factor (ECF subfamily)
MTPYPKDVAPSDETLMLVFSQGSSEAFTELFHRYKQPLYAFFHRRLGEPAQAEELTQETFLALMNAATRYEPRALFRTYLYAIAFRILKSYRRKTAFRALITGANPADRDPGALDATEHSCWVRHAMAKLEATEREILMLREFEQLSYAEISDLLLIPLNTVRSRLFRARLALKAQLGGASPQTVSALEPSHEPNS